MKRINTLYIALLLLLSSCINQINFEDKFLDDIMVVNSFLSADSLVKVKLFSNISINEGYPHYLTDAEVSISEEGGESETLSLAYTTTRNQYYPHEGRSEYDTTYFYVSLRTKAKAGISYNLTVNHPNYETVKARATVPMPTMIGEPDTSTTYEYTENSENFTFHLSLLIEDEPNINNYYRLVINKKYRERSVYDSVEIFSEYGPSTAFFSSNDPVYINETEDANNQMFGTAYNSYNIFSDALFNGEEYPFSFYMENSYISSSGWMNDTLSYFIEDGEFYQFSIEMQQLTKDTYLYLKSVDSQHAVDHLPFIEPVPIFSNIENGIGIFGALSSSTVEVTFGEYPNE